MQCWLQCYHAGNSGDQLSTCCDVVYCTVWLLCYSCCLPYTSAYSMSSAMSLECCMQVLRDLGISEARLQNSLLEVWNKTDLLPSGDSAALEAEALTASTNADDHSTGAYSATQKVKIICLKHAMCACDRHSHLRVPIHACANMTAGSQSACKACIAKHACRNCLYFTRSKHACSCWVSLLYQCRDSGRTCCV